MFAIGDLRWPGVSKVIEEAGELLQILGKLMGTHGEEAHWDGSNLRERLIEETGDLQAAVAFLVEQAGLDRKALAERVVTKLARFRQWHHQQEEGVWRQQILIMTTTGCTLRSEAEGWTHQDSSLVDPHQHIGHSPSWDREQPRTSYDCVVKAMADGWRLMAPPERHQWERQAEEGEDGPQVGVEWTWWLERWVQAPQLGLNVREG